MRGISSATKGVLDRVVDELFDRVAINMLGKIPAYRNKKAILFSSNPTQTLARLFLEALGTTSPLPKEEEALKMLLDTAHGYVESLKAKTKAKLADSIDSYVKEQRMKGIAPSSTEIKNRITEGLNEAGRHIKTISEAESTKARNTGKLFNIAKAASSVGVSDPYVFFVVVKDNVTCSECIRLHLMPDKITPRVWKMSEVGFSYHKKGEPNPKVAGAHPHCRCSMTVLLPGYGFKGGKASFISDEHDEYKKQRGE